jgi:hypothetical protein
MRLCLRTSATNGPILHPPSDMWTWKAMVRMMMMPAGDNSWLVHKSSLTLLPAKIYEESRKNGRMSENFAYQYLKSLKGSLTCRKILRHGTSGFTSHPKEGVLQIFIALKNPSPRPGLNPRPLGPVISTLTTTPPRRFLCDITRHLNELNLELQGKARLIFERSPTNCLKQITKPPVWGGQVPYKDCWATDDDDNECIYLHKMYNIYILFRIHFTVLVRTFGRLTHGRFIISKTKYHAPQYKPIYLFININIICLYTSTET